MNNFDTLADLQSATVDTSVHLVDIYERVTGDGPSSGGTWARQTSEPAAPASAKVQDTSGAWFQIVGDSFRPEQFGAAARVVVQTETETWYNACVQKPNYLTLMAYDRLILRLKWRDIWPRLTGLWILAAHNEDAAKINIVSPGTYDATFHGGLTFDAGVGVIGNGIDAYVSFAQMNQLFSQNDAYAFISSQTIDSSENGNLASSTGGTAKGFGINPYNFNSPYFYGRLMSNTAISVDTSSGRANRNGSVFVNRPDANTLQIGADGRLYGSEQPNPSIPPASDSITVLRSGGGYTTGTVNVFLTGQSLDALQSHALNVYVRDFLNHIGGVLKDERSAADIGFDVSKPLDDNTTAIIDCAYHAAQLCVPIHLDFGTYEMDKTWPLITGLSVMGADRRGTIVAIEKDVTDPEIPVFAPPHFDGGERGWRLQNFSIHGGAMDRGITGVGIQRPGGSGISTNGSQGYLIERLDIFDAVLHNIDNCNTGEVGSNGVRKYVVDPQMQKVLVGTPSSDGIISDCLCENCGDDNVTAHYSDNIWGYRQRSWYTSGRHGGGPRVSMGWENDDGSHDIHLRGLEVFGLARGYSCKSHDYNPAASNCTAEDIVTEMCGQGVYLNDPNKDRETNNRVTGIDYSLPHSFSQSVALSAILVQGTKGDSISGLRAYGGGATDKLANCVVIGSGAIRANVTNVFIDDWVTTADGDNGATVYVTGSTSDCILSDMKIFGAGEKGVKDTGGDRQTYYNITVEGTNTTGSIGFDGYSTVGDIEKYALRVIGGFGTEKDGNFV